jgi:hypothetical protein
MLGLRGDEGSEHSPSQRIGGDQVVDLHATVGERGAPRLDQVDEPVRAHADGLAAGKGVKGEVVAALLGLGEKVPLERRVGLAVGRFAAIAAGFIDVLIVYRHASLYQAVADGLAAYQRGDYPVAYKLCLPWAQHGNGDAMFLIGLMYANGHGVRQNYAEAARWYRQAADQGDALSQALIGGKYDVGQGVPQDYVMAHMWFNLSAAQGVQLAIYERDFMAEHHMTPAQIAEAQRLAREWKPKSAPR